MTAPDLSRVLNHEQLAAVTHGEGPQLVLAGAGSGKTRVITYRVAWLVDTRGVDPAAITAVTFTNKAANEMQERIEKLLDLHPLPAFVGTFHRFALRLLRAYGDRVALPRHFAILDTSDQMVLVKRAIQAEELPENFRPQAVLAAISGAKNRLLDPAAYERSGEGFFQDRVAPVYRRYQALLRESAGIDFDDMIFLAVKLLREDEKVRQRARRRTRFLLVDEFQDTNLAQISLIQELTSPGGNLTAVGDEDQSIYRWRGAEIDNILNFERGFPGATIRKLERNYRSTQTILDAAGTLVEQNVNRRGKTLWTKAGAGRRLQLFRAADEQDEARWVTATLREMEQHCDLGSMAVLVRTNAQTRAFEEEFLRREMPYTLVGGLRFYERAEIKDLVAYLRLLRNPYDVHSLNRVINRPVRGIGQATQKLLHARSAEVGRPLWDLLADDDLDGIPQRGARALRRFREMMESLIADSQELPLPEFVARLLEVTSYTDLYDPGEAEGRAKLDNVRELLSAVGEFAENRATGAEGEDLLTAFLDHASLVSADDVRGGQNVSLMTLHSAKGLEFSVVVIAGLEEDLLPHFNVGTLPEDLEEERRLLYVGMTRARKRLLFTSCRRRRVAGTYQDQTESRFVAEIPARFFEVEESPTLLSQRGDLGAEQFENVYEFLGREKPAAPRPEPEPAPRPEAEARPSGGRLRRGSRVRHPTLGLGRVLSIEGSGVDMRLTVFFDGVGRRKLVARYANLEVI